MVSSASKTHSGRFYCLFFSCAAGPAAAILQMVKIMIILIVLLLFFNVFCNDSLHLLSIFYVGQFSNVGRDCSQTGRDRHIMYWCTEEMELVK